jgi:hypothetical protein
MSITSYVAIAIISVFASIVYEFTVIGRFIAEQNLNSNYKMNAGPQDIQHRELLCSCQHGRRPY